MTSTTSTPSTTSTAKQGSLSGLFGVLAVVASIGAGIYLLQSQSASPDTTVFDAIMHGLGAYMIARGLWMLSVLAR